MRHEAAAGTRELKCAMRFCSATAEWDSNFCKDCQPLSMPQTLGREGVAPPLSIVIIGCILAAAALIAVKLFVPASVQTSARLQCEAPTEHETRLIYLNARADGAIDVACGPAVGGSNSAARRR